MCSDTDFQQRWFSWGRLLGNSANADDLSSRGSLEICQPVTPAHYCFAFWSLFGTFITSRKCCTRNPQRSQEIQTKPPRFDPASVPGYLSEETSDRYCQNVWDIRVTLWVQRLWIVSRRCCLSVESSGSTRGSSRKPNTSDPVSKSPVFLVLNIYWGVSVS